jgi:hypothetical protein
METFSPPLGLTVTAAVLGGLLLAILPTCLYLYVEPRGRLQWAAPGDTAGARRAPALVRLTAWMSFAVGQLAIPWLFVPVACGVLLFLQAKLGVGRPTGFGITAAVGVAGLVQSFVALRLIPLGVRLLSRDGRACSAMTGRARWNAFLSAGVLAGGLAAQWAMLSIPDFVHPWLRAALVWTALRPVIFYAGICFLHALLLGRCAKVLACPVKSK